MSYQNKTARQRNEPVTKTCAFCLEACEIPINDEDALYTCSRCGTSVHERCYLDYETNCTGYGKSCHCPTCRASISSTEAHFSRLPPMNPSLASRIKITCDRIARLERTFWSSYTSIKSPKVIRAIKRNLRHNREKLELLIKVKSVISTIRLMRYIGESKRRHAQRQRSIAAMKEIAERIWKEL